MLVIVPPQSCFAVVEKLGYADGYGAFMRLYITGHDGFCQDGCLSLPTWNHLRFMACLWADTMVLGIGALTVLRPLFGLAPRRALPDRAPSWNMTARSTNTGD